MPAPVINKTQSVLGYPQWQAFAFQPAATNTPTGWSVTGLPPGVSHNPLTGRISGAATMPGVYNATFTANNADGSSSEVFHIGIEASGFVQPSNSLEVLIDLVTRQLYVGKSLAEIQAAGTQAATNQANNAAADKEAAKIAPAFWCKYGDDLIFNIRFIKNGVIAAVSLTALKFVLKEFEPESTILESVSNAWQQIGAGTNATYRLHVKVEDDRIAGAFDNYTDDQETKFLALGEFEWQENNPTEPRIGPATLRGSTRTFGVTLPRDLAAN